MFMSSIQIMEPGIEEAVRDLKALFLMDHQTPLCDHRQSNGDDDSHPDCSRHAPTTEAASAAENRLAARQLMRSTEEEIAARLDLLWLRKDAGEYAKSCSGGAGAGDIGAPHGDFISDPHAISGLEPVPEGLEHSHEDLSRSDMSLEGRPVNNGSRLSALRDARRHVQHGARGRAASWKVEAPDNPRIQVMKLDWRQSR